jgi:ABC-type sugar transport system ATPase subunit
MPPIRPFAAVTELRFVDLRSGAWTPHGQGLEAVATQVEHLGAETVVRLRAGEHLLHALIVGGSALQPGAAIRVALPPEALLFFDGAGGRIAA